MIARLIGHLHPLGLDEVVVDVGGVGYHVHVPVGTSGRVRELDDGRVTLLIHTSVREDAITLFGFATPAEKAVYRKLISVSGIGPKLGLSVLSDLSVSDIVQAVEGDDYVTFTRVSGVGKKTAQKLVLELTGAFGELAAGLDLTPNIVPAPAAEARFEDLRSALSNLEYKPATIDQIIGQLQEEANDTADLQSLLRRALKLLRG